MRHEKRFKIRKSPLVQLDFWRVILDESQMIESTGSSPAEMALKLRTQHRWCVTGTPVQRGVGDLYGLFRFLRASPLDDWTYFRNGVLSPLATRDKKSLQVFLHLFKKLFWRNTKALVRAEMRLPPQTEVVYQLTHSAQEADYYSRIEKGCRSHHPSMDEIIKLRQACVHPQLGAHGVRGDQHGQPMDMAAVLEMTLKEARLEQMSAERDVCRARCVLASFGELGAAVQQYQATIGDLKLLENDSRATNKMVKDDDVAEKSLLQMQQADASFAPQLIGRSVTDGTVVRYDSERIEWTVRFQATLVEQDLKWEDLRQVLLRGIKAGDATDLDGEHRAVLLLGAHVAYKMVELTDSDTQEARLSAIEKELIVNFKSAVASRVKRLAKQSPAVTAAVSLEVQGMPVSAWLQRLGWPAGDERTVVRASSHSALGHLTQAVNVLSSVSPSSWTKLEGTCGLLARAKLAEVIYEATEAFEAIGIEELSFREREQRNSEQVEKALRQFMGCSAFFDAHAKDHGSDDAVFAEAAIEFELEKLSTLKVQAGAAATGGGNSLAQVGTKLSKLLAKSSAVPLGEHTVFSKPGITQALVVRYLPAVGATLRVAVGKLLETVVARSRAVEAMGPPNAVESWSTGSLDRLVAQQNKFGEALEECQSLTKELETVLCGDCNMGCNGASSCVCSSKRALANSISVCRGLLAKRAAKLELAGVLDPQSTQSSRSKDTSHLPQPLTRGTFLTVDFLHLQ